MNWKRALKEYHNYLVLEKALANNSIEEISNISSGPKLFQLYVHKDKSITDDLLDRCKRSGFDGMCFTVDTLVAGNREKDHRTGFTTPPKLTLNSLLSSERALNIKINEYEEYKDLNIYFRDLNLVKGPNYDSVKANFVVEDDARAVLTRLLRRRWGMTALRANARLLLDRRVKTSGCSWACASRCYLETTTAASRMGPYTRTLKSC